MAEKRLNARLVNKHDIESNWILATNFTPKQGEIIVYDIDDNHAYERFKIGDGVQNVNDLPFYNDGFVKADDQSILPLPIFETYEQYGIKKGRINVLELENSRLYTWVYDPDVKGCEFVIPCDDGTYKIISGAYLDSFYRPVISATSGYIYSNTGNEYYEFDFSDKSTAANVIVTKHYNYKYLGINNSYEYIPSGNYNPATKKYVDDAIVPVAESVDAVSALVGDTAVSEQIDAAIAEIPQADWNQNDENAADYVKNRTHWEEENILTLVGETSITPTESIMFLSTYTPIVVGKHYVFYYDGVAYEVVGKSTVFMGYEVRGVGNMSIFDSTAEDTGEPFAFGSIDSMSTSGMFFPESEFNVEHIYKIDELETIVHHLDPKYIKDMYYEDEPTKTVLVPETTIDSFEPMEDPLYAAVNAISMQPVVGATYCITWDGVEYEAVCSDAGGLIYIGNENYTYMQSGGNIPFAIIFAGDIFLVTESTAASHTLSISELKPEIHYINPKYIKDMYYETEPTEMVFMSEMTVENNEGYVLVDSFLPDMLQEGLTYIVTWNGEQYECVARALDEDIYIGNQALAVEVDGWEFPEMIESYEPFFISTYEPEMWSIMYAESGTHTFSINVIKGDLHQIDIKYLPIFEKSTEVVFDEEIIENNRFEGDSYRKLVGSYKVTVDGESEVVEFIDDGDYSYANTSFAFVYRIETWDGGVWFDAQLDGGSHWVTIQGNRDVIKEEYLPNISANADWEETDEDAPGYIKNKPDLSVIKPKDYMLLNDAVTGLAYKIEVRDGNLVSSLYSSLDDFTYTTNSDGTRTITGWSQTYIGEPSTIMCVPDDSNIIL